MPDITWHSLARRDLLVIVEFIADDNPDAAQQFKNDLDKKIRSLVEFPKLGRPGRVPATRELVIAANYIVVYREYASEIHILRVLHAAQ